MSNVLYSTDMHVIDVVMAFVLLAMVGYCILIYIRELRAIRSRLSNIEEIVREKTYQVRFKESEEMRNRIECLEDNFETLRESDDKLEDTLDALRESYGGLDLCIKSLHSNFETLRESHNELERLVEKHREESK